MLLKQFHKLKLFLFLSLNYKTSKNVKRKETNKTSSSLIVVYFFPTLIFYQLFPSSAFILSLLPLPLTETTPKHSWQVPEKRNSIKSILLPPGAFN